MRIDAYVIKLLTQLHQNHNNNEVKRKVIFFAKNKSNYFGTIIGKSSFDIIRTHF